MFYISVASKVYPYAKESSLIKHAIVKNDHPYGFRQTLAEKKDL